MPRREEGRAAGGRFEELAPRAPRVRALDMAVQPRAPPHGAIRRPPVDERRLLVLMTLGQVVDPATSPTPDRGPCADRLLDGRELTRRSASSVREKRLSAQNGRPNLGIAEGSASGPAFLISRASTTPPRPGSHPTVEWRSRRASTRRWRRSRAPASPG